MAEEPSIEPVVIKKTQDILGKYVKKPPLTEKLLKKPPFRFLQDVINAIIKETTYLNGLYTKVELSAEGITDRNAKIAFLQKLIDVLKLVSNEDITARPSKIVAGHEPTKTNELLQVLGNCLNKNLDFKAAIAKVTGNEKKVESKKKVVAVKEAKIDKKQEEQKSNNKVKVANKDKTNNNKGDIKVKNTNPKENLKEKTKPTPSKIVSKEKGKLKKGTRNPLPESSPTEKKDEKSSPQKSEEFDRIKENSPKKDEVILDSLSQKNEIEIKKTDDSRELSNQINGIQLLVDNQKDVNDDNSVETKQKTSPSSEIKKSSATNQRKHKPLDEVKSNNENILNEDEEKNKIDPINLDSNIEKSPKNIKTKENRKSSGKNQKSSTNKRNSILPVEENYNINTQNDSSIKDSDETLTSEPRKPESNKTVSSAKNNLNKSQNSQSETLVVKRQSTFTREESRDSNGRPRTSLRPPSVRPPSARPGAPRRRDKNFEIVLQPNDQVKLAGIQLKVESFNNQLDDDGENLVIIENENVNNEVKAENKATIKSDDIQLDDDSQQGHLVQQILETQKELIQNHDQKETKDENLDIATIQNRQSSAKQMNSLRDVIQNLTRSVNPLGKLMDFIPEDMDAMQLEMNMWRDLYSQTSVELKKEKSLTESAIEPMKNQLEQINGTINEYIEMIDESRTKILQNSDKISQLLTEF